MKTTMNNKPYTVIADCRKLSYDEWLKLRKSGIGGSDCAAACGLSRWKTRFELWLEKSSRFTQSSVGEAAYWGRIMEPILRDEFSKRTGFEVKEMPAFFRSTANPFMQANIDGCVNTGNGYAILEIKTAGSYAVGDWEDGLPVEYYLQIQHYLGVIGASKAYVAVLLGGNKFSYQEIARDEDMIKNIIAMEQDFWNNYVVKNVPPPVVAEDKDLLSTLYPAVKQEGVALPENQIILFSRYMEAKQAFDEAQKAKDAAEAELKAVIKDAGKVTCGAFTASWTETKRKSLSTERVKTFLTPEQLEDCTVTTTSRRFSVKSAKQGKSK
ncbi:putative uncharacterized protein [Phascolarctobacterium sp. CAG:266]|nr:putative uncharacterized protein [Phascolarctobacterium sp. CAG:266]